MGLASIEALTNEVKNLKDSPKSFIEIENFMHQQCLISSDGDRNHLSFGDLDLSSNDTLSFVDHFVYKGMGAR